MYNYAIHSKIALLGQVMDDLRDLDYELQLVNDPALVSELLDEKRELLNELDEIGGNCITVLESYMKDCKAENIPVCLDYYRVLRELKNARIL